MNWGNSNRLLRQLVLASLTLTFVNANSAFAGVVLNNSNLAAPKVVGMSPSSETLPAGIVEFKIDVADVSAVKCVSFSWAGLGRELADCQAPFSITLDTRKISIPIGMSRQLLTVGAFDANFNRNVIQYQFDIDSSTVASAPALDTVPPVFSITSPAVNTWNYKGGAMGAYSFIPDDKSKVNVTFSASDDSSGIQRVEMHVFAGHHQVFIDTRDVAPFAFEIDPAKWYDELKPVFLPSGVYAIPFAYDKAGNLVQPSIRVRSFVYNNYGDVTGPTVKFITPTDGSLLANNRVLTVEVDATDPSGVAGMQIAIGRGIKTCYLAAPPFICSATVPISPLYEMHGIMVQSYDRFMTRTISYIEVLDPAFNSSGGNTSTVTDESTSPGTGTGSTTTKVNPGKSRKR